MSKKTIATLLPGRRWLIAALAFGVAVAVVVPTLAQSISGDKWVFSSPSRSIDEIDFDSSGVMWTKPSQAGITSLNPTTDAVTNWTHENSTIFGTNFGMVAVQQVEADIDRHIWSTFENGDHINRLNTATGEVVSWPLPSSTICARHNLAIDGNGDIWFGQNNEMLARLEPDTNTVTTWPLPSAGNYCPQVFDVDGNGDVWVCEAEIDKIGKLDPDTNLVTEWTISGSNFNDCRSRDASGNIWFSRTTKEILRLNPATDALTIWACQLGCSNVEGVSIESNHRRIRRVYEHEYMRRQHAVHRSVWQRVDNARQHHGLHVPAASLGRAS